MNGPPETEPERGHTRQHTIATLGESNEADSTVCAPQPNPPLGM